MHVVVVGGGVLGLSLAWHLAKQKVTVTLIDRQNFGREASWAGAGILPPANLQTALDPYDQLRGLSMELHPRWAEELRQTTGIDTGFSVCGGIYLARTRGEAAALIGWGEELQEQQIPVEKLDLAEATQWEPGLRWQTDIPIRTAFHLPTECQLRNPWHLQALEAACRQSGVRLIPDCTIRKLCSSGGRISELHTTLGNLRADRFCFTTGAWTTPVLASLGIDVRVIPIRGQMVLYRCSSPPLTRIVNEGSRYIVPRKDGYVLVGSTEEEVGFDKSNTAEGIAGLRAFAESLIPALATAEVENTWAGLRPGSFDGLPFLGAVPEWENVFLATGHFRSGLYISPATSVVMAEAILDRPTSIDLAPFRLGR